MYQKSYQNVDYTKGRYLPVGKIVQEEGGWDDAEAVKGVMRLCARAIRLGEPWIKRNAQTGRLNYLYLEEGFEEKTSESWLYFKSEVARGTMKPPAKAVVDKGGADPPTGAGVEAAGDVVDKKADKRPPKSVSNETPPESCDNVDKKTWVSYKAPRNHPDIWRISWRACLQRCSLTPETARLTLAKVDDSHPGLRGTRRGKE